MIHDLDTAIANLDRRIEFLRRVSRREALFEAYSLVQWILSDPILAPYASSMLAECAAEHHDFHEGLATRYAETMTVLDDVRKLQQDFAFDPPTRRHLKTPFVPLEDFSDTSELIETFFETLRLHPAFRSPARNSSPPHKKLFFRLQALRGEQIAQFRAFSNRQRFCASASLAYLTRLVLRPTMTTDGATDYDSWMNNAIGSFLSGVNAQILVSKQDPVERRRVLQHAERVCMHLRLKIGTTHTHQVLARRFATRVQWYERERLRTLADEATAAKNKQPEARLLLEFARYLFDCGLPVFLRSRVWKLEPDLFSPTTNPLLAEGKAYTKASRQMIIDGLGQLFSYMANIDGDPYQLREAYYVVFRLGGPLYVLPPVMKAGNYRIFSLLIDLGDIDSSGRRQATVEPIEEADFLPSINAHSSK
ncbi:MAG: hypothetical protein IPK82_27945 [Polyangiaceae bacterium]|nr:hypothetical protein [Polyangiaceae bacterium]